MDYPALVDIPGLCLNVRFWPEQPVAKGCIRPEVCLCHDLMERISYLMGIHRSLRAIFSNHADYGYHWVRKPNKTPLFNGQSALQFMLSGRTAELAEVHRYLASIRNL
ncbi:hypothetical protein YO5_02233 [Stutzerimonas stutzeri TS44]|nr:hypothetical protein YO5_02233 [Stutzerimonas stutzeri TS44]